MLKSTVCSVVYLVPEYDPLTHDNQLHLLAADTRSLLHFTLVGARVGRLQPRQVDRGIACLWVTRAEVNPTLHGFVVVLVYPVA